MLMFLLLRVRMRVGPSNMSQPIAIKIHTHIHQHGQAHVAPTAREHGPTNKTCCAENDCAHGHGQMDYQWLLVHG